MNSEEGTADFANNKLFSALLLLCRHDVSVQGIDARDLLAACKGTRMYGLSPQAQEMVRSLSRQKSPDWLVRNLPFRRLQRAAQRGDLTLYSKLAQLNEGELRKILEQNFPLPFWEPLIKSGKALEWFRSLTPSQQYSVLCATNLRECSLLYASVVEPSAALFKEILARPDIEEVLKKESRYASLAVAAAVDLSVEAVNHIFTGVPQPLRRSLLKAGNSAHDTVWNCWSQRGDTDLLSQFWSLTLVEQQDAVESKFWEGDLCDGYGIDWGEWLAYGTTSMEEVKARVFQFPAEFRFFLASQVRSTNLGSAGPIELQRH